MSVLEARYPHPRDARIVFHEEAHEYVVDGVKYDASVSAVVHAFFPQFNAAEVIDKYYDGWAYNKKSRYFQLITYIKLVVGIADEAGVKAEIAKCWSANGKDKAGYGTAVHRAIELYLNDEPPPDPVSVEFRQFLDWKAMHPTWEPYRTEWSIFHEGYGIAGQIDSVWKDTATDTLHMVDWKVVGVMSSTSDYNEKGFQPFQDLPNTNLHHYAVQQNLYKFFLEEKYDVRLESMRLVQLHETLGAAVEHHLPDLQALMPGVLQTFVARHRGPPPSPPRICEEEEVVMEEAEEAEVAEEAVAPTEEVGAVVGV